MKDKSKMDVYKIQENATAKENETRWKSVSIGEENAKKTKRHRKENKKMKKNRRKRRRRKENEENEKKTQRCSDEVTGDACLSLRPSACRASPFVRDIEIHCSL